jgi:hypothetical protein
MSAADTLIWDVMRDRGYPADNKDASMEALSVYHARPLDGYRKARDTQTESTGTEELRTTLIRYRALFQDLVGIRAGPRSASPPAAPAAPGAPTATTAQPAARGDSRTRKIAIVPPKTAGTRR